MVLRNHYRLTQTSEDSLGPSMVQAGHPAVPLDPAHHGCSGCPEDGVGWECSDGVAALSQTGIEQLLVPGARVRPIPATPQDQWLQTQP